MVRVVTESTADIPAEMAKDLGIEVIPSYVVFGTETYRDGLDLTREQFYERLSATREMPTTAAPSPGVYEEVYRRLAQETDGIVSIHLTASLSSLYSVAAVAATRVPEARIVLIDSQQVTMGYGWLAVAAAEAARQGQTLEQIVELVEDMKKRSCVLAILDTLDYVYRGGRVGWAAAMLGTLLRIKPIVEVREGEVRLLERARSRAHALDRLLALVQALGPLERAVVLHAGAPDWAEQLAAKLPAVVPGWKRLIGHAGVTIASHAGPGAVGIACVVAKR
jgi:DegV family protein with EDD domain